METPQMQAKAQTSAYSVDVYRVEESHTITEFSEKSLKNINELNLQ